MNVVLGVLVLVLNGQIQAAHAVGAYPTIAACTAALHAAAPPEQSLPAGSKLGYMCADLSANIDNMPGVAAPPKDTTDEARPTPGSMSKNYKSTDL